ncbi:radical SAM protein [Clostridium sp. 19966]|uniref:radical SAM/SPASM domain-containing protein n=1 Tax=Clostridium sp. 19966 TaxID=2768166 RepID=UPI0028DE139B|nr:radical SAM/SPASM domain-containing protein [Clostridium sp. 19966]MDT8717562.1 radical SAM protein [Clostridium sp. 19966]
MKRFKKVYIEITNICNLKCEFCPQTQRKANTMDKETFKHIVKEVQPYTDHIYFHVKGEPLLHPYIEDFLDISEEAGLKVNITTNGTLLKNVGTKLIGKRALRQINISLHSFDANEKSIDIEEYINEIVSFSKEITEKSGTIAALRLWNLDKSNKINLAKNKNRHILNFIEEAFKLNYNIEEKFTNERGQKIAENIYLNQDHEFQWPSLQADSFGEEGFCQGLKQQIAILSEGTVVPCCLDGEGVINLGNIKDTAFKEIIEGDRAKKILEGFSRRKVEEELCKRCGFRTRF